MKTDVVRCVVIGHNDGPDCPLCKNPMDTAKALESTAGLDDVVLCYCFTCLNTKPQESVLCLLKTI